MMLKIWNRGFKMQNFENVRKLFPFICTLNNFSRQRVEVQIEFLATHKGLLDCFRFYLYYLLRTVCP